MEKKEMQDIKAKLDRNESMAKEVNKKLRETSKELKEMQEEIKRIQEKDREFIETKKNIDKSRRAMKESSKQLKDVLEFMTDNLKEYRNAKNSYKNKLDKGILALGSGGFALMITVAKSTEGGLTVSFFLLFSLICILFGVSMICMLFSMKISIKLKSKEIGTIENIVIARTTNQSLENMKDGNSDLEEVRIKKRNSLCFAKISQLCFGFGSLLLLFYTIGSMWCNLPN